ncbi:MAG: hypothetical protein JWM21_4869 [Acidobacteria bacterium]|nr:hypothetical protein [Acidobacteriota bacterium]
MTLEGEQTKHMAAKSRFIPASLALIIFTAIFAGAQTSRVFVAASGNDANLCTQSAQCRTVTKALTVVDTGGEVVITESGDYDKFQITKSVTVAAAPGVNAGIASTLGDAIFINGAAQTDAYTLRNLTLKGNLSPQSIGINEFKGGNLSIDGCTISGFDNAINVSVTVGQIFVHDSTIRDSTFGIGLIGPQSEGMLKATIDNCTIERNEIGIAIGSKVSADIRNTVIANSNSRAVQVRSTVSGQSAEALIDNCQFNHNTVGIQASATNGFSTTRLTRSTINGNVVGVSVGANAAVFSLQNNLISGNTTDVSGSLSWLGPK